MLKNKTLLISAISFGGIGIIITFFGFIWFLADDSSAFNNVGKFFGMSEGSFSLESICKISSVFELCAFILTVKSLKHEP